MLNNYIKPNYANNKLKFENAALCCCLLLEAGCSLALGPQLAAAASRVRQQQASQLSGEPTSAGTALPPSGPNPSSQARYFGTLVGPLSGRLANNISGLVYAVDEQTLFLRNLNFDGLASDTYFWSSTVSPRPAHQDGFIVPDEKGSTKPLERYAERDVVLRLPEGKTLREIQWLSIWSRQAQLSLAEIHLSRQLLIPRPLEIGPLSELAHGVRSGPITIVDAQTFLVPDFHYDGLGPAAYFWLTRGSQGLAPNGLRLKDENGSSNVLRKYQGETLVISLPDELTIYDFDFFGVWCRQFSVNFGQVRIPQQAKVPPSPKMLGIKPENKLNCEILYDDLGYEIRWVLDGDDIVMQLVGKIEPGEYMAFGLGKDDSRSDMDKADAVVAWVDRQSGQVHAHDYYLGSKNQCVNDPANGSCPDTKLPGGGDSLTLLHGAIVNGYSMVTFKRPQLGVDEHYDQHVYSDGQQSVLWAIGALNSKQEVGYHRLRTRSYMFIDFARNPQWNCPIPDLNATLYSSSAPSGSPASQLQSPPLNSAASQVDPQVVTRAGTAEPPAMATLDPSSEPGTRVTSSATPSHGHRSPQPGAHAPVTLTPAVQKPQHNQQADKPAAQKRNPISNPTIGNNPVAQTQTHTVTQSQTNNETQSWFVPSIVCPSDRLLYAQIGPTGGKRGFEGLTGQPGWGVAWYINGLLIPELVLERGQTYRFVVEGGNDKTTASRRHPLYLTDSPEGGYEFKTDEERLKERIFGGVALRGDGQYVPTAEGRLCEWKQTKSTLPDPDQYASFASYQRSLKLECSPGQANSLKFTPDSETPDLIYYQCYSYRQMGWRIRLVNSCQSYINSLGQAGAGSSTSNPRPARESMNSNNSQQADKPSSLRNKLIRRRDTSAQIGAAPDQKQELPETNKQQPEANKERNEYSKRSSSLLIPQTTSQDKSSSSFNLGASFTNQLQQTGATNNPFESLSEESLRSLLEYSAPDLTNPSSNNNEQSPYPLASQQYQHQVGASGTSTPVIPNSNQLATANLPELGSIPNDLLIINGAQLMQKQPLNLSNYDQVLKLAPSDVEIIDVQQQNNNHNGQQQQQSNGLANQMALAMASSQLTNEEYPSFLRGSGASLSPSFLASEFVANPQTLSLAASLWPNLAQFGFQQQHQQAINQTANQQQPQNKNSTKSKPPKGLQVYIKRLASIYYPVQQQLASITNSYNTKANATIVPTSNQNTNQNLNPSINQHKKHKYPSSHEHGGQPEASSSSFSLYNLMPKPKIDLSKSTITKKLNKFRFKSAGWRGTNGENPNASSNLQQQQMKPPTPNNEFNYDIFNNQLAQLEKQQQQLETLEALAASANWAASAGGQPGAGLNQQQQVGFDTSSASSAPGAGSSNHHQLNQATFGYLSNLQATMNAAANQNAENQQFHNNNNNNNQHQQSIEDQQAIDSMKQQTYPHIFNHHDSYHNHVSYPAQHGTQSAFLQMASFDEPQSASWSANQNQHQNYRPTTTTIANHETLAYMTSNSNSSFAASQPNGDAAVYSPTKIDWPAMSADPEQALRPSTQTPSIYITRLTDPNQKQQNSGSIFSRPVSNNQEFFTSFTTNQETPNPSHDQFNSIHSSWAAQNGPQNVNALYPASQRPRQEELLYGGTMPISGHHSMSTLPSITLTTHHAGMANGLVHGQTGHPNSNIESLSGSGSGSYFEIRPQPNNKEHGSHNQLINSITSHHDHSSSGLNTMASNLQSNSNNNNQDTDHMLAIERYSKQSSERQPPAIVHPITGELVTNNDNRATPNHNKEHVAPQNQIHGNQNKNNHQHFSQSQSGNFTTGQARRYPQFPLNRQQQLAMGSYRGQLATGSQLESASLPNEILEVEQSMRTSELQRVNSTVDSQSTSNMILEELAGPSPTNQKEFQKNQLHHQSTSELINYVNSRPSIQASKNLQQHHHQPEQQTNHPQQQQQMPTSGDQLIKGSPNQSVAEFVMNNQQQQDSQVTQEPNSISLIMASSQPIFSAHNNNNQSSASINQHNKQSMDHQQQPIGHRSKELEEIVYRSNLIEPLSSTLVPPILHNINVPSTQAPPPAAIDPYRFDPNPFTPIDIQSASGPAPFFSQLNNQQSEQQQDQHQQSLLMTTPMQQPTTPIGAGLRLRSPPSLIESLISGSGLTSSSNQRPQPPVQVASYLASRLTGGSSASSSHMAASTPFKSITNSPFSNQELAGSTQDQQLQSASPDNNETTINTHSYQYHSPNSLRLAQPSSELIILKPALQITDSSSSTTNNNGDNKQQQQQQQQNTYALRPEYMTTTIIQEPEIENPYSNEIAAGRLAAHQFDRLSSLSSPPTTSILVDPLQAANTILSYSSKQQQRTQNNNNNKINYEYQSKNLAPPLQPASSNEILARDVQSQAENNGNPSGLVKSAMQQISTPDPNQSNNKLADSTSLNNQTTTNIMITANTIDTNQTTKNNNSNMETKMAQHRQTILAGKQQILANSLDSSHLLFGDLETRLNPGGDSTLNSVLRADNKTDNAILSHVMSLISSNALPITPILPVASYSRADYLGGPFARSLFRT